MFQHHKSGKYPQGQFPHFTAEEATAQKLGAPIHGHTACKRQTQEAKPRLQVQAVSSGLTLSPRGSRAAPTQGSPTRLAWPQPPAQTGQGESGEGPGMGVRGRVKAGATSSGALPAPCPVGSCLRPVGIQTGRLQGSQLPS